MKISKLEDWQALQLMAGKNFPRSAIPLFFMAVILSVVPVQTLPAADFRYDIVPKLLVPDIDNETLKLHLALGVEMFWTALPADQSEITEVFQLPALSELYEEELKKEMLYHMGRIPVNFSYDGNSDWDWLEQLEYRWRNFNEMPPIRYELKLNVRNEGSAPMEVVIRQVFRGGSAVDGSSNWQMAVDGRPYSFKKTDHGLSINVFQDIVMPATETYDVTIIPNVYSDVDSAIKHELIVTLRRPTTCIMTVKYDGDLAGEDFGDVAYYNDFLSENSLYRAQGGVANATGSANDTEVLYRLNQLMEMTGSYTQDENDLIEETDDFGFSTNPFSQPTLEDVASSILEAPTLPPTQEEIEEQRREEFKDLVDWAGGNGEVPADELETFGLTMVARKRINSADGARGLGLLANGLTLEAASRSKEAMAPAENIPLFTIPLSRLEFSPPGRMEGSLDRVRFKWETGSPGFASMQVFRPAGSGVLAGAIQAHVFSHKFRQPDGRDSWVKLEAKFFAAEGALSCDKFP